MSNGPTPTRRRRSSAEVRERILDAARELFSTQGYDATSTQEIAERAQVSKTLLFRNFENKSTLLQRALAPGADDDAVRPARRGQRSSAEVRQLLLDAARELFSAQGYTKTTTRHIADRAGVQEMALFRAFGTKAALFQEAVFEPFGSYIRDYATSWMGLDQPHSAEEVTKEFMEGLYRVIREHRGTIFTLLAARAHEDPGVANADGQQAILNELIAPLEALCAQEAARFGYTFNIPVATRISVAMVLATAIFKEWLFPQGEQPSDEEIVDELLAILLHGIAHRSPA